MKRVLLLFFIVGSFIIVGCSNTDEKTEMSYVGLIMVDNQLYAHTGEGVPIEVSEDSIKNILSVIQPDQIPSTDGDINMPFPDSIYAKINDYEEYVVVSMENQWIKFIKSNHVNNNPPLNDLRPMIKVGDKIYLDTGNIVNIKSENIEVLGEVVSSVSQTEVPRDDGQTNFGSIGSIFTYYHNNILIHINDNWILFESETSVDDSKWSMTNLIESDVNTESSISIDNINYAEYKISYTIKNETDSHIYYGAEIMIEKLINENWYIVPMLENVGFDSMLYNLSSKSDIIEDIPLSLWVTMSSGQYRLIKRFSQDEDYKDTIYVIGEFQIMD